MGSAAGGALYVLFHHNAPVRCAPCNEFHCRYHSSKASHMPSALPLSNGYVVNKAVAELDLHALTFYFNLLLLHG